jgi:hypothetical protein
MGTIIFPGPLLVGDRSWDFSASIITRDNSHPKSLMYLLLDVDMVCVLQKVHEFNAWTPVWRC